MKYALVHVCKTPSLAAVGVITDQTLRQLARKAGRSRVDIGLGLHVEYVDIQTLQAQHTDPDELAFQILMVNEMHNHYALYPFTN